jgi:hypothetical protein
MKQRHFWLQMSTALIKLEDCVGQLLPKPERERESFKWSILKEGERKRVREIKNTEDKERKTESLKSVRAKE